jgi:hypothetical protein
MFNDSQMTVRGKSVTFCGAPLYAYSIAVRIAPLPQNFHERPDFTTQFPDAIHLEEK